MPKHSNTFVKSFKEKGKYLVFGLILLIIGVVAFLAFQEETAVKIQKDEIFKRNIIGKR